MGRRHVGNNRDRADGRSQCPIGFEIIDHSVQCVGQRMHRGFLAIDATSQSADDTFPSLTSSRQTAHHASILPDSAVVHCWRLDDGFETLRLLDPKSQLDAGEVVRDDAGKPMLLRGGTGTIRKHTPKAREHSRDEVLAALGKVLQTYNSVGTWGAWMTKL